MFFAAGNQTDPQMFVVGIDTAIFYRNEYRENSLRAFDKGV
jgi:hypothetical protein